MNLLKKIVYFVLSIQEGMLIRSLSKTLGAKYNSKRKRHYSNGCLLTLDSIADIEKQNMEDEISLILKNLDYEPSKVLEYIKSQGTEVFYIDNGNSLYSIGENEGFIYPKRGAKALYLSSLVYKKFRLKTPEMFVLSKGEINKFYFIYHFYNWYMLKHNIEGMEPESQELLKKYLIDNSDDNIKNLQLVEIYKLKDAIKQDKLAIEFVFRLCQKLEASQSALQKMKNGGTNL